MSTIHSRSFSVSLVVLLIAVAFGAVPAMAACIATNYDVNPGAPASENWTTTSLWVPSTSSPGVGTCDTATNTNVSTTIIVNSTISNPLAGLTFNCAGCLIDIQTGGQLTIDGPGVLSGGAIVKVNGGTLVVNTPAIDGGVTFQSGAQLHLISGTVSGSGIINIDPGATVLYDSSSSPTIDGVTIKTNGTMTLAPSSPATLTLNNGAIIDNWGLIDIQTAVDIANGAGTNGIKNGGTFQMTSGATTLVDVIFDNLGGAPGVNIISGVLSLAGGGNGNAPFTIGSGSTLDIPTGTYSMQTGGVVSGAGTLAVTGGTLSIGGVTEPGGFRLSSGTLTGDGFLSIGETLDWSGGTITGNGGTELAGGATGNLSGSDGVMTLDGRTFNNYGSINFTSGTNALDLRNGAVLGVYGTFAISTDGSITCDCTVPPLLKVAPNGFFYKIGGAGTFLVAPPTENTASIASFSGTLQFSGGGTHGGNFFASSGNTVMFSTASTTFAINSSVNADGTIAFASGSAQLSGTYDVAGLTEITGGATVTVNAASTTTDLTFATGTLILNADFSMSGTGTWSCGQMQGTAGSFNVDSSATLIIDGALSSPTLDTIELVNDGLIDYTSVAGSGRYLTFSNGAFLTNNGTFDIQTDAPIVEDNGVIIVFNRGISTNAVTPSVFTNNGTLLKSAGAGTSDFEPELDNAGDVKAMSGTLNFVAQYTQTAGSTILGPGDIQISFGTLALDGGVLTGAGTITGDVQNSAQVAPGTPTTTGLINITDDYTQTSSGSLAIKLGGPAAGQFDQLTVGDASTLDGTFTATLINSYAPANGTTFPVLTFASNSGAFATENLPTYSPNGSITSSYNPTSYDLTAVVTPASADLRLQMSGPANVNAGAPLSYTITVDNLGPDATSGTITVANTLPAGATSASGSGWSCGAPVAGVITCTNGTALLAAQSLPVITISMTAPASPGGVTNSATVSAVTSDPSLPNNTDSVNTTVVAQADLAIVKTGPGGVTSGQNIVYTITVTNNGPSQAVGVIVSDPTVPPLGFVSNSGACAGAYPCNLGTLNAGQTATITSTYSTPPNFDGDVINTATVSATTADPDSSDNSSSFTTNVGAQADLSIVKTGPALTNPGQDIVYTITVTNNGPSPATNTIVTDPTPIGIAFLSNSGACATTYPCNVGMLNAGQSVVITSTYTVPGNYSGATVINTAGVSSDVNDPNTSDNSSTTTASVAQETDLSITKTGPVSVTPGQSVTYTITATNDGPANAANVVVADPTPTGLTFVSNTGACNTPFPCNVGTLVVNQSAAITTTFSVPINYSSASITNTATVSSDATELDASDNTASATTTISVSALADVSISKNGPSIVAASESITFTITVTNAGPATATGIIVTDPTPSGLTFTGNSGACATPFPCNLGSLGPGQSAEILATYTVDQGLEGSFANTASGSSTSGDPIAGNNSDTAFVAISCAIEPPELFTPAAGDSVSSPVAFSWTSLPNAVSYTLNIVGPAGSTTIETTVANATATLPSGAYSWTVTATTFQGCSATSDSSSFTVCGNPIAPAASVVGTLTTGQSYSVQWPEIDGASTYELEESSDDAFATPVVMTMTGTSRSFTRNVASPTAFFYRVRALFSSCGTGPFSPTARIVVVPLPSPNAPNVNVAVQAGSTHPVTFQLFIPGLPEGTTTFVATADKPWLAVTPMSGIIPPAGILVTISADPASLTNGTWTGTIVVAYGSVSVSRPIDVNQSAVDDSLLLPTADRRPPTSNATTIKSIPVSISLVTPITPSVLTQPGPSALVIPAVGHLAGAASNWFSDVRLANVSADPRKYQLTLNSGAVKKTTLDVGAGVTTALDDLVRNWYGLGSLGDSANGVLIIEPLDSDGKVIDDPVVSKATVVSSRTYNASATSSAAGTLGQFIPATLFGNFIGRNGSASSILSLQQVADSALYRTNLGLAEAAGLPAQLNVSIFGATGARLFQLPLTLNAGEQRQLNSFIAQNGLSLTDGRIEVEVVGGDGKVTAYASVVDNLTQDPLVVSGVPLGGLGATRFVVPGVADLNTGAANWRSDVRVFNSGAAPQLTTLTFFPSSNPSSSTSAQVTINPGEVKALDGILASLFQLHGVGGSLHVTTAVGAPLVVTARTYNQTAAGTVGQFIPAVTDDEAVGVSDRTLHIVQAEESSRYRTNLGITEISGNAAIVEVSVTLPDSKISPTVQIPLAANESRQLAILNSFGLGAIYNARISVRVIEGDGRVTAYGSIIDRVTEDPTFVPAQ